MTTHSHKQVNKDHYGFDKYVTEDRWNSLWEQINETIKLNPRNILEIGPGPGLFKLICQAMSLNIKTLDLDPDLKPDYVGSVTNIPIEKNAFELVCGFQILEHLPYKDSINGFQEMLRISKKTVIISLPDSKVVWPYTIYIPKLGKRTFHINKPFSKIQSHEFDGEHHWEINKKGYELEKIIKDFSHFANLKKTFRVSNNPYHRFFIFTKLNE